MAYNRNMNNMRYTNRGYGYQNNAMSARRMNRYNQDCEVMQRSENDCDCNQDCADVMQTANEGSCANSDCQRNDLCIDSIFSQAPVGMAYVPWQSFGELYCEEKALMRGTIFKELDLEFLGRRVK